MTKNVFEDMVRIKRAREEASVKSVGDGVITSRPEPQKQREEEPLSEIQARRKKNGGARYGLWFVAAISVVFLFFAVSLIFSKAKVAINPEIKELSLNQTFSASKGKSTSDVSFDIIILSDKEEKSVEGGEEKEVKESAKGQVYIYNTFSSSAQTLDIDTRLLGTNGKIYKTEKKISVPGIDKAGLPGKIKVGVYASEPGSKYNTPPLDFKIVGFKGTPKYDKFYGRSEGDITGGLVGASREISNSQKDAVLVELKDSLNTKLMEKAREQIPSGFVLWRDAVFLDTDKEEMVIGKEEDTTIVSLSGTLYGFLFSEEELSKEIIIKAMTDYDESEAYIYNLKELNFTLLDKQNITSLNANSIKNIKFTLSGNPRAVYKFNTEQFISNILGKSKSSFQNVISQYPHVQSADLVLLPAWKRSFPQDIKDIEITVNYPN